LTLKNMNYSAIKDGHWYLVKSKFKALLWSS
jgi:hypothetical protein